MNKGSLKDSIKSGFRQLKLFYTKHTFAALFITFACAGFLSYMLYVPSHGTVSVMKNFFNGGGDIFMDFFNSIRDVAQGPGVYTWRNVIYPPMANLIMLIFSSFVPKAYSDAIFAQRYTWTKYPESYAALFAYMAVPVFLLFLLCYKQFKEGNKPGGLLALFTIFNLPVLYMLERGNILIYSVVAVLYYIFNYDSESRMRRELSLLALAFAFSLKLYPAILGLPLLADKRYKDAIRCAVYALLMLVLPSFFFGGPQCFILIFDNVTSFSSSSYSAWTQMLFRNLDTEEYPAYAKLIDHIPFLLSLGIFAIAPFVQKKRWKVWISGIMVLFAYPALNSLYAWAFFLAPLVLLLEMPKLTKTDWLYAVLIAMPFIFLPLSRNAYNRMTTYVLFLLIAISGLDTLLSLRDRVKEYKAKRRMPAEKSPDPQVK